MANWNDGSKKRSGCFNIVLAFVAVLTVGILMTLPVQATTREFTSDQIEFLSGKAIGESSIDPYSVACVMWNRLEGGWAPGKVYTHFHALWVPPTPEQAQKLEAILKGNGDCNQDAWYQFSKSDVVYLNPRADCLLFESGGNLYYAKCAFLR